jgi:hypothetical protein
MSRFGIRIRIQLDLNDPPSRLHLIILNRRNIGIKLKKLAQVLHDLVLG